MRIAGIVKSSILIIVNLLLIEEKLKFFGVAIAELIKLENFILQSPKVLGKHKLEAT
jgi:hypothetical protein